MGVFNAELSSTQYIKWDRCNAAEIVYWFIQVHRIQFDYALFHNEYEWEWGRHENAIRNSLEFIPTHSTYMCVRGLCVFA